MKQVRFNLLETRRDRLTRAPFNKRMTRHSKEPVQNHRENGGTAEIQYGRPGRLDCVSMFKRNAVVISCPSATLARMSEPEVRGYIKGLGVKRIAILGDTNDLVARDRTVTPVEPIQETLERLIAALKDDRMKIA